MARFILTFLSLVTFLLLPLGTVSASTPIPSFPSCTNPQGTVKVHYDRGTHGIVGNPGTFTGRDTVYQLTNDTITQCFCADDGAGIQTNWWRATSITDEQKKQLENEGWKFIPNGADWGLENTSYYAKNNEFTCKSNSVSDPTNIFALAATGEFSQIIGYLGIACLSFLIGWILSSKPSNFFGEVKKKISPHLGSPRY